MIASDVTFRRLMARTNSTANEPDEGRVGRRTEEEEEEEEEVVVEALETLPLSTPKPACIAISAPTKELR